MATRPPKPTLKSRSSSQDNKLGISVKYDDIRKQLTSTHIHHDVNNNNQNNNLEHINMSKAVFNKAFTGSTDSHQAIYDEKKALLNHRYSYQKTNQLPPSNPYQTGDSLVNVGDFIGNDAIYLHDDLSQLPQIDEKILTTTLKNRFENRKFYVRIATHLLRRGDFYEHVMTL